MALTLEDMTEMEALAKEREYLCAKDYSAHEDVLAAESRMREIDVRTHELAERIDRPAPAAPVGPTHASVRLDFIIEQRHAASKYYNDAVEGLHQAAILRVEVAQDIDTIERRLKAREAAIWLDPEHPALAKLPKRTDEMVKNAITMQRETDEDFISDQAALTKARQERDQYDVAIRTYELSVSRGKRDLDFLTALLRFAE